MVHVHKKGSVLTCAVKAVHELVSDHVPNASEVDVIGDVVAIEERRRHGTVRDHCKGSSSQTVAGNENTVYASLLAICERYLVIYAILYS